MASVFLSYAREDRSCAEKLAKALEVAGHRVWWDRWIDSGAEFAGEIETALGEADVVLVAWSDAAARSPWVRDEAAVGRDTGRLLPILIDGSQAPMGFRQFQALDLTGWKGSKRDTRTVDLLRAVDRRLKTKGKALPVARRAKAAQTSVLTRRKLFWGATAALVLLMVAGIAFFMLRPDRVEAEPASLAVLPFKTMSAGDPYFAEGVAEEISNQLAREPQFKVAGRTSSALFKDAADLRDVGRRLHVAYVLEGSVRSAGKQVRVDVSLVDTRKGVRLWSQDFRGTLDDIFAIQDSIGRQVAAHLKRRLIHTVVRGVTTTRGDVYELYVTARSLIRTREPAKLATAVDLLQRAVKIDPNYAPAWARLSQALKQSRFYGHEYEAKSDWVKADELAYARRAITLAPDLAEAHAVLGSLLAFSPNVSQSDKLRGGAEIERAVKLDPTDAQNWYWLHNVREGNLDFEGALAAMRQTAEIDPFFTFSDKYSDLAWDMGDRKSAIQFINDRIQNHPDPYIRERARERLAYGRADWSDIYQHLKRERELAPPDMRSYADLGMGLILMRLGLIDAARPHFEDPWFLDMWSGKPPPNDKVRDAEPLLTWLSMPTAMIARVFMSNGRTAEIVSLYDRAFPSPDAMLERSPKVEFTEIAPIAAAALRDVGRRDEAAHLLTTADGLCAAAMRKGRTPISFQVNCSRTWAMLGRREQAIQTLDRALKANWRPEGGWSNNFVDDPVYRDMRDDPRLKRLGQFVLAEIARERRELLNSGL
jgi:TolB-like protein/tetratricopeptide (TPR) repeat protein